LERIEMKTYPIWREDGNLRAVEVTSAWLTYRPRNRLLRSVADVTEVKREWFGDDRIIFKHHGEPFVVWEAYGDSNRFWIGPKNPPSTFDPGPLYRAFQEYQGPITRLVAAVAEKLGE
jgi:hypothetical protein